jgi:hypothetical protein
MAGILWQLAGGGFDPGGSFASGVNDAVRRQTLLEQIAGAKEDRQLRRDEFGYRKGRDTIGDQHWQQTYDAGRTDAANANARANASLDLQRRTFERGDVPAGYERDPNDPTRLRPRAGGPQDPATIRATTEAQKTPLAPSIKEIELSNGNKVSVRVNADGSVQPLNIPGLTDAPPSNPYAGNGKMTQDEKTSAIYADRMGPANKIISQHENINDGFGGFVEGMAVNTGRYPNVMQSTDRQLVEQAKRDFVNAVLRRESGAVINPSEFANAERQYFPQPGDSKEVIAQKRRNRETALHAFYRAAGPHYRVPQEQSAPSQGRLPPGWSVQVH